MIYSIIDIGTNSVRFMLAEYKNASIFALKTDITTTRLGKGMYNNNTLTDEAMEKTANAVKFYADLARKNNSDKIICTATSAVRDAENKIEFKLMIKEKANIELRILSGEEEALAGFRGAVPDEYYDEDTILVDIGGGSTEIMGLKNGKLIGNSYKCGCVRLKELFDGNFDSVRNFIKENIIIPACKKIFWIGGTASAAAMIYKGLCEYDAEKVHLTSITREYLDSLLKKTIHMNESQLEAICSFEVKRGEILNYGLLTMQHIMDEAKVSEVVVSESGLMNGLILLDNEN